MNKLFAALASLVTIAISLLFANKVGANPTEYVFTAPPEVDNELVEIPASETDYPLYECDPESDNADGTALDSHDCTCTDCEDLAQDSESNEKLPSENKQEQE
ncbi:hypothetical protein IQ255_29935 [Pleurocapsales cyanobacterium LEGE 10410]|nr:hypothetical protein [Pleurocapsales cyanobacterium LEGE 10410]